MKILHTADIHLKKGEKKRIEVFKWLIEKADQLKVDYFIIAGDLFESDADASAMRNDIKKIFEDAPMEFLIIPGNHDERSYNHSYGKNVTQLIQTPFEIIKRQGCKICGLPYQDNKFSECIRELPNDIDILIAHGTIYDQSFIFSMLDDEETEYMPIYPENLENIARYVAMGHIHSQRIERQYKKTKVVYPGSPIALNTKCEQARVFELVTIDKKLENEPIKIEISPHWQKKDFFIFPGIEEKILSEIESYLNEINDLNVMPNIIIKGFIGKKDQDFTNKTKIIEEKYRIKINSEVQPWDIIIENPMVKKFVAKTEAMDNTLRMKVFEITLPIFSKLLK